MGKFFSVIIPHYNSFEKLERLVYSIPENENIEIIIIDDDSKKTIFSEEIVEKLKVRKVNHLAWGRALET